MSQTQEADITGNTKLFFSIRCLINIEKQIEVHKRIRYITSITVNDNIQSIAIPKDATLNWYNLLKKCLKTSGK